jgi:predicted nucleic acid-binding protein
VAERELAALEAMKSFHRLAIPVIVLGEYRIGITQSRRRVEYENWLNEMIDISVILDVDEETTRHYAAISLELRRIGRPIPINDIWIAAICRQHGHPLISRDHHFDYVPGLKRIGW